MEPTVTLTRRLVEPPNTFRATEVGQMYDLKWSTLSFVFRYDVGIQPNIQPITLTVRNRTVSHDLLFQMVVPDWLTVDIPLQFILNRKGEIRTVTVTFNELTVREISKTRQFHPIHDISLVVTPMQVQGPVYVMNSTDPL